MRWKEDSASSGRRRVQEQPRAGEIGLHRRERLVQLVADRGRHLAERGELRGLLEALLGLLQVPLHPLPRADLGAEPPVQHPELLGFALDAPALGAGPPRQQVEGEREQERQHHDDQRQDRVHPGAHVLERGEVGQPPVAEADRHLDPQVRRAGDVDVGRRAEALPRLADRPADPRRVGAGREQVRERLLPPVRLGGEQHLVVAVGHHDLDPRAPPALLVRAEVDGDHDDAEQLVVLHDPAGVVEAVGAVVVLDDREDGAGVVLGGGEVGLVAVVLLARALVARRDDPALGVEQEDRAGADLLAEARQPLLGALVLARAQRQDQDRVAREQQRHHRMALHRALDRAGVERGAHRRVGVLVLAEGAGEVDVARPDHQQHAEDRGEERRHASRNGPEAQSGAACRLPASSGRPYHIAPRRAQAPCRTPAARAAASPAKSARPVGAAVQRIDRALGVRHQAQHPAVRRQDAGDVARRAVGVRRRSGTPPGPRPRAARASRRRRSSCRRGGRSAGGSPRRAGSRR